ncbi:MAG: hypothetical protein NTY35_06220 [Planctomycetota bacterium]|nr:hypothetical protein [Planctomycetota bacterium]
MLLKSPSSRLPALALVTALCLSGCSGGGSGTGVDLSSVDGLTIGDQMSVVTVGEGSTLAGGTAQFGSIPSDSDYVTDVSRSHVYDPSMESLQTVNMILCLLKQTAYSGLVNEGLYKAQIDEAACGGEDGGDSGTGQSSGDEQQLSVWVIESTRASNSSDQTLEFWIPPSEHGDGNGPAQIRARMTISESASESNPFGVFDLNWMDVYVDSGLVRGFGNLHSLDAADGFIGFSFYEENGDVTVPAGVGEYAARVQANVNMFADQTQGVAHILRQERNNFGGGDSGVLETEYRIAFDPTNVLRGQDDDAPTCLSRTEFSQNTWRYNLYDSTTGERVELNSGFGFRTQDGEYGWAGYYGLWTPENVTVEHGDTVTRQSYGNETAETYTVFQAPGKLVKKTRNTLALENLAGVEFEWFDYGTPGAPDGIPSQPTRNHVEYQAPSWVVTETQSGKGGGWTPVEPPIVIPTQSYGFLGMWCPELGGSVGFVHGSEFITYFAESVVTPEDPIFDEGDVTLYGYFECLDGSITSNEAEMGDIYQPNASSVETPYAYRFDSATMTLRLMAGKDVGAAAGLAEGAVVTQGPYTWGLRSGPLVLSTAGFTSTFDIWGAETFYTYETGNNPWNRYTALIDANGDAVAFDAPIEFSYTHATGNDANGSSAYDGRTFLLSYNGPGNLHGIPFEGVDLDGDTDPDRYLPVFTLADGTILGSEGQYIVRAIDSEYTLQLAPGQCGSLSIDTVGDLALPDEGSWTEPAIGTTPTVLDAPRVIEGVVVGSGI